MTINGKQRKSLATRPLFQAVADTSRTAFTVNTSEAPRRSESLLQKWSHTFRAPVPRSMQDLFRYMVLDNRPEFSADGRWCPVRPLGHGSFGAVGLFEHRDSTGQIDDYVVAKYAQIREKEKIQSSINGISKEAAIMIQLNEVPENEGVLFLRNFRHYADVHCWLYLTEYCPNFDLETLRLTYKAMRRPMPEVFLWYVFYAMVKGLVAMEVGPLGEYLNPKRVRKNAFVLHRDIKQENIFLGFSPDQTATVEHDAPSYMGSSLNYPHAKIADFGVSVITTVPEVPNMAINHEDKGNWYYKSPELRISLFKKNSSFYPFEGTCMDRNGNRLPSNRILNKFRHKITPAANVFSVGMMMYELASLDEPDTLSDFADQLMTERVNFLPGARTILSDDYVQQHHNGVRNNIWRERLDAGTVASLEAWKTTHISSSLKKLIEACLSFRPEERVNAADLLRDIEKAMANYLETLITLVTHPDPKAKLDFDNETQIYASQSNLDQMPHGHEEIFRNEKFWDNLVSAYRWADPAGGMIQPDFSTCRVDKRVRDFFSPGYSAPKNQALVRGTNQSSRRSEEPPIQIMRSDSRDRGGHDTVPLSQGNTSKTPIDVVSPPNVHNTRDAMQRVFDATQASWLLLQQRGNVELPMQEQQEHMAQLYQKLLERGHAITAADCRLWLEYCAWDPSNALLHFMMASMKPEIKRAIDDRCNLILDTHKEHHQGRLPVASQQLTRYMDELRVQIGLNWPEGLEAA